MMLMILIIQKRLSSAELGKLVPLFVPNLTFTAESLSLCRTNHNILRHQHHYPQNNWTNNEKTQFIIISWQSCSWWTGQTQTSQWVILQRLFPSWSLDHRRFHSGLWILTWVVDRSFHARLTCELLIILSMFHHRIPWFQSILISSFGHLQRNLPAWIRASRLMLWQLNIDPQTFQHAILAPVCLDYSQVGMLQQLPLLW